MDHETRRTQGMRVRRDMLGDEHVDAMAARTTTFTAPFQDLVARHAWGDIWSRPGLDRRTRSMLTVGLLAALGLDHELGMHVRGAVRGGVTAEEIAEVLLQMAVYAGVPSANHAFTVAQATLAELGVPAAPAGPTAFDRA